MRARQLVELLLGARTDLDAEPVVVAAPKPSGVALDFDIFDMGEAS